MGFLIERTRWRSSKLWRCTASLGHDGSLDSVISIGRRVKSKRGVQFGIRAGKTLRDHLFRGYPLNEGRLTERGLDEARTPATRPGTPRAPSGPAAAARSPA